jgi:hypothetical protein
MLWPAISQPVCLDVKHTFGAQEQIFITITHLWVCWCGMPFVTRGWVCHSQLLLTLTSAVLSGLSPMGLITIFYYLRFDTHPTWRARSPYLYLPGTGWSRYIPKHRVPFSLPPMARRAMVAVFEAASTHWHWPHRKYISQQFLYCCLT